MIFPESATDIVHAAATLFGWKDAVLVCDVGDSSILIHYNAAGKTFVERSCSDRTSFKTVDEALHRHAGESRGDIIDIAKIHGISLRAIGERGEELFFCSIAVCVTRRAPQPEPRLDAKPQGCRCGRSPRGAARYRSSGLRCRRSDRRRSACARTPSCRANWQSLVAFDARCGLYRKIKTVATAAAGAARFRLPQLPEGCCRAAAKLSNHLVGTVPTLPSACLRFGARGALGTFSTAVSPRFSGCACFRRLRALRPPHVPKQWKTGTVQPL